MERCVFLICKVSQKVLNLIIFLYFLFKQCKKYFKLLLNELHLVIPTLIGLFSVEPTITLSEQVPFPYRPVKNESTVVKFLKREVSQYFKQMKFDFFNHYTVFSIAKATP